MRDDNLPTPSARKLADYMSAISEEAFYARWLIDLEYYLWSFVCDGPGEFGEVVIDVSTIAKLKMLSSRCGGWIIFVDLTGLTWIPMEEWIQHADSHGVRPLDVAAAQPIRIPTESTAVISAANGCHCCSTRSS